MEQRIGCHARTNWWQLGRALGLSRDDSGSFLPGYAELELVKKNPFALIDQTGVGQLVRVAAEQGSKLGHALRDGEQGRGSDFVKFVIRTSASFPRRAFSQMQTTAGSAGRSGRVGKWSRRGG